MRGFFFPADASIVDWKFARLSLMDTNPHLFMGRLMMGGDQNILAHMIIPTQFGILHNKSRQHAKEAAESIAPPEADWKVIKRQHECLNYCAACNNRNPQSLKVA